MKPAVRLRSYWTSRPMAATTSTRSPCHAQSRYRVARGKAVLVKTTAAGRNRGKAGAPELDWGSNHLRPNPPQAMATAADQEIQRMIAATGKRPSPRAARKARKASSLELSRPTATRHRPLSTLHDGRCRTPCKTRFRLAGCAFAGRESNPLGSVERFQIKSSSFPGLRLTQGQNLTPNNIGCNDRCPTVGGWLRP